MYLSLIFLDFIVGLKRFIVFKIFNSLTTQLEVEIEETEIETTPLNLNDELTNQLEVEIEETEIETTPEATDDSTNSAVTPLVSTENC